MHPIATTTPRIRAEIQASGDSIRALARQYGINPKTVAKWKSRNFQTDLPAGTGRSGTTNLTAPEQEMCLAFRKATLLPLDDCLYALQLSLPHLSRAGLHRLFQRHGISRLPDSRASHEGMIGDFYINAAPVRTGDGIINMVVAFDRVSKFAYAELYEEPIRENVAKFLVNLMQAVPYEIHNTLTSNSDVFVGSRGRGSRGRGSRGRITPFRRVCLNHQISHEMIPPEDPWNISQTASAKRMTGLDARQPHYDSFAHLREHFFAFFDTYNFTRRLKTLSGRTPHEFLCRRWETNPELFDLNPAQHLPKHRS